MLYDASGQKREQMTFVSTNRSFGCIATVQMWWNKLIRQIIFGETLFELCRSFVIKYIHAWFVAPATETLMDLLPASLYFGACFRFQGAMKNTVAVIIIDDEEVFIATRGAVGEATSEVVVGCSFRNEWYNLCTCCMCFDVWDIGWWEEMVAVILTSCGEFRGL